MQLFQVRPLDFIIKPIDFDKILHVVKTYERLYETTNKYFSFTFNKVNILQIAVKLFISRVPAEMSGLQQRMVIYYVMINFPK